MLRFEVQFKRNEIQAIELSDQDFYHQMVRRWESEYFELKRQPTVRLQAKVKEVKTFAKLVCAMGLDAMGGSEPVLQMIETAHQAGQNEQGPSLSFESQGQGAFNVHSVPWVRLWKDSIPRSDQG